MMEREPPKLSKLKRRVEGAGGELGHPQHQVGGLTLNPSRTSRNLFLLSLASPFLQGKTVGFAFAGSSN